MRIVLFGTLPSNLLLCSGTSQLVRAYCPRAIYYSHAWMILTLTFHYLASSSRYRAPGESWTKKFKHVVGILHTNYFQYVLDQPAALIRVRASCCFYLQGNILRKSDLIHTWD
jgi:hypothetical protein